MIYHMYAYDAVFHDCFSYGMLATLIARQKAPWISGVILLGQSERRQPLAAAQAATEIQRWPNAIA